MIPHSFLLLFLPTFFPLLSFFSFCSFVSHTRLCGLRLSPPLVFFHPDRLLALEKTGFAFGKPYFSHEKRFVDRRFCFEVHTTKVCFYNNQEKKVSLSSVEGHR